MGVLVSPAPSIGNILESIPPLLLLLFLSAGIMTALETKSTTVLIIAPQCLKLKDYVLINIQTNCHQCIKNINFLNKNHKYTGSLDNLFLSKAYVYFVRLQEARYQQMHQ
jgi:hypothetical protein